jgi:GDP-4-dehydro-6-deoxy-D-mannose reductase
MEKGSLGEVYHVATGKAVRIQEILDRLLKLSNIKMDVVQDKNKVRKSEAKRRVGSAQKLKESTGWVPRIGLQKSLEDILEWWQLN